MQSLSIERKVWFQGWTKVKIIQCHNADESDSSKHQDKQNTEYYQQLAHERYKIEAKNAELKNEHGYAHTVYTGQHGMTLQAGVSIFVVNLKRILNLKNTNTEKMVVK